MREPSVYVVDDDDAVREVLCWLMESVNLPVEEFSSADAFLAAYDCNAAGCLLLDIRMPGMSGLELQRKISWGCDDLPIIIITGHADVPMAVEAMKNGAFDFIEKPFNNQVLLDLVQKAIQKSVHNAKKRAAKETHEHRLSVLTPRERQVLDQIVGGETNKVAAKKLGITQKTVEAHRAKVLKKLSVRSLADLVRISRQDPISRD
ncbi:MAG: response regulator transcription factor [Rhodospirillales bacterium]|nr:response regulator transcription factor [Rhodospirillales bacterium]